MARLHLPGPVIGRLVMLGGCYLLIAAKISTGKLVGCYLLIAVKPSAGILAGCHWLILASSSAQ
jgi:hypothetical protein